MEGKIKLLFGTVCPLSHQRNGCFCEGGGCRGLTQDGCQADDGGVEKHFVKVSSATWAG
jgi:hypothetical protein